MKQRIVYVKRWVPVIAALALIVAVGGCGSDGNPAAPGSVSIDDFNPPLAGSGLGMLAVSMQAVGTLNDDVDGLMAVAGNGDSGAKKRTQLTDLFLTFDSIRVYPVSEDSAMYQGDGEGDGDSTCVPIEFLVGPLTLNAAELDTSLALLLGTLDLPAGDYSHLSVRIVEAWVVTVDGETYPVELPGDNEYLKVGVKFTVADGQVTEIMIRFDLARSVVETPPGSKVFILKPVMHGVRGHGEGYLGDMRHGRGHGGTEVGSTTLNTLGGDQVMKQIASRGGNDNGTGNGDQDRARDGSCDSTCTGVPDQDQIRDRNPIQDRDRDGSCLTTLGGDQVMKQIASRGGNNNGTGNGDQDRARDGSCDSTLTVIGALSMAGDQTRDQIKLEDGTCDSTGVPDQDKDQDKTQDKTQLRDPIQDRDHDGICDGTAAGKK